MKKNYTLLLLAFIAFTQGRGQCVPPQITIAPVSEICSGAGTTLTAVTDAEQIAWFDVANGGNPIATGDAILTGSLLQTTSFWAEARNIILGTPTNGGKPTKTSSGGTTIPANTSPWGLSFSIQEDIILNSVDVFLTSGTPGDIVIELKDSGYNVLQSVTVSAPAGGTSANPVQFTVPLDMEISAGNNYRLLAVSGPAMNRDLGTNAFPFALGTIGSITGGTINNNPTSNSGVYYFFYNWNFTPYTACSSARQEVIVEVNVTAPPLALPIQPYISGQTLIDLDATGQNLKWYSSLAGATEIPSSTIVTEGTTYYVSQTEDGCESIRVAVIVTNNMSVGENRFSGFKLYPNPVENILFIENNQPINNIILYTLQGQKIFEKTFNSLEVKTDISMLSGGTYLAYIQSGDMSKKIKIVKK